MSRSPPAPAWSLATSVGIRVPSSAELPSSSSYSSRRGRNARPPLLNPPLASSAHCTRRFTTTAAGTSATRKVGGGGKWAARGATHGNDFSALGEFYIFMYEYR